MLSKRIIYFNCDYNVFTTLKSNDDSFDDFLNSITDWGKSIEVPVEIVNVLTDFELNALLTDLEFNTNKVKQQFYEEVNHEKKIINLFGNFEEVDTLGVRGDIVLSKDRFERFHICESSVLNEGITSSGTITKIDEIRG